MTITVIQKNDLDTNKELLQTGYWAEFKEQFGWKAYCFKITSSYFTDFKVLILLRKILKNHYIAYSPFPLEMESQTSEQTNKSAELIKQISAEIRNHLPKKTIFIRFDLPWNTKGKGNIPTSLNTEKHFKKTSIYIQPLSTVLLDIASDEKEILSAMNKKTRYNIKLAFKKGVKIIECGAERLEEWYSLYEETKQRDKIAIHSLNYYKSVFRTSESYGENSPEFILLLAKIDIEADNEVDSNADRETSSEVDNKIVAGIIVGIRGTRAYYLYGASSNKKRNFMPNHALQWRGIQIAKQKGCETYDFCGIPSAEDPSDPMHGLYRFKTGFGGTIINRFGCYDYIYRGFFYRFFSLAENLRNFYYKFFKKISG